MSTYGSNKWSMSLRKTVFFASLLVMCSSNYALAAQNIFVKWPGATGDATQVNHLKEIAVQSVSGGIAAQNNGQQQGKVQGCGQFYLSKSIDSSSTYLYSFALAGTMTPSVIVSIDKTAGNSSQPVNLSKLNLKNVWVTGIQQSNSEDGFKETVTIQAQSVEILYTKFDAAGRPITPQQRVAWNCSTNSPFSGIAP